MFVNKHDSFRVTDSALPINVKYVSFAGYDSAPTEFYYNCTTSKESKKRPVLEILKKNQTDAKKNSEFSQHKSVNNNGTSDNKFEPHVKKVYFNSVSLMDFGLLTLCSINMAMNIVQLYSIYLCWKYLDS